MAAKLDLSRRHRREYGAFRNPAIITVGLARYLTIAGRGRPGGPAFGAQVGALYAVAFTVKMARKRSGRDFVVSKLEGVWWGGRPGAKTWSWKLMIRVPAFVSERDRAAALAVPAARAKTPFASKVRLETLREGRVVQLLHIGPYDAEVESIARMRQYAQERGLKFRGRHHEIYLSDPRRVAPRRLRTILRHPVS